MARTKRFLVLLLVLIACAGCDQATKSLAEQTLAGVPPQSYAGGLIHLAYTHNTGAFLGLGASLPPAARFWIFTVLVTLLLVGLLIFALRISEHTPLLVVVAIALVIGGGLSNLIDRLLNDGQVVDFMLIAVGPLHTGIFNVADVAIMVGLGLMVLASFRVQEPATG